MSQSRMPLPEEDRIIAFITVTRGQASISYGKVVAVSPVSLVIELAQQEDEDALVDASITLMYSIEESSYSLKVEWGERLNEDKVLLRMKDDPRRGERREFIRADLELQVGIYTPGEHQDNEEGAREYSLSLARDPGCVKLRTMNVDLSGSGIRLILDEPLKKDSHCVVVIELEDRPGQDTSRRLYLPARVIRSRPAKGMESGADVAIQFLGLTPLEGDYVHALVFASRLAQIQSL